MRYPWEHRILRSKRSPNRMTWSASFPQRAPGRPARQFGVNEELLKKYCRLRHLPGG